MTIGIQIDVKKYVRQSRVKSYMIHIKYMEEKTATMIWKETGSVHDLNVSRLIKDHGNLYLLSELVRLIIKRIVCVLK
jgi:hypothetical protein